MGYNIWPTGDGPNERHARLLTLMAAFYTVGFMLWAKVLLAVVRFICTC